MYITVAANLPQVFLNVNGIGKEDQIGNSRVRFGVNGRDARRLTPLILILE